MAASEFVILGGMIAVGLLFFLIARAFIFRQTQKTMLYGYKAEAEEIADLVKRVSHNPSEFVLYCMDITLANLSVKDGILSYEKDRVKYSFLIPESVELVSLNDTATICIVKSGNRISLLGERPACTVDGFCAKAECNEDCPDCYGPASICVGDGYCNLAIGENCENSVDCSCNNFGPNYTCCPSDPKANEYGCVDETRQNLDEGEECFCDNECKAGLKCNPTTEDFKDYEKACCEEGKSWNGRECIITECKYPCVPGCQLPKRWDWRNVDGINYLNPVRDQGRCGSCWAFSAVGAVEGVYNIENDCPSCNKDLSEQNLVSNDPPCCGYCGSCNGGRPHQALHYFKTTGVVDEECCSYFSSSYGLSPVSKCPLCSDYSTRRWKLSKTGTIAPDLRDIKRAVICHGPLSVASRVWAHAVVLVGYDDTAQVWIIRNSWGPGWGDKGYGYIPYSGHSYSDIKNYVFYVQGVLPP